MMNPRYREVKASDIPEYKAESGVKVKVIAGKYNGRVGPVKDIICDPEYLDVSIPAGKKFEHKIDKRHTVFAYVLEGEGYFDPDKNKVVSTENLVLFSGGENVVIETSEKPFRFLLISGKPIDEPVAWYGPIVMNTEEELEQAFEEYQNGTFIKD
jgi:redox-sensitive bicupin YhaK (pirin superfamily)